MSDSTFRNRRTNPDGTKGMRDVTNGTENEESRAGGLIGRRKFLILGGAGAAVLVGTAGVARALITAGGDNPSPRSLPPVGLDPGIGREPTAVSAPPVVRHFALAGTDGWVSMPNATFSDGTARLNGGSLGAKAIDPYFPDPLAAVAGPPNTTTFAFCFRNVTGLTQQQVAEVKGHTQICAPLFYSTVGEEIWVTLSNLGLALRPDLVDSHTLHWHGFRNAIPFYDGVPESSISVPIGRDFTYVYRPKDSGTYMYHCHFEDVEHVTMGMHGIVFVKPNPSDTVGLNHQDAGKFLDQKAYGTADGDASGKTRYDREYAIMLSEVDTRAHFNDAHIQATDWTDFQADFWTMNGRAYPDTLEPNGVRDSEGQLVAQKATFALDGTPTLSTIADYTSAESRLFSNPLSSVVYCSPGERILIRFANLGFLDHSFVFPGLQVDVLGRDARYVPPTAQRTATDSIQIGPGESRDVFFTAPAAGTYPFYDRGLANYTGSADGSDAWVGGQRSEIRVIAGLAPQNRDKPNGWPGENPWPGEFPMRAHTPQPPTVTKDSPAVTRVTGQGASNGTFLHGTALADQGNNPPETITSLRIWRRNPNQLPSYNTNPNTTAPPANQVTSVTSAVDSAGHFDYRAANSGATTGFGSVPTGTRFWVQAIDNLGHGSAWVLFQA